MKSPRTIIAILFCSLVIVMLGFGIAIPLMPFFVTHFNASGSALGLMMSLYSFMQFLFAPIWGRVSDRIGRRPVLLIGIVGYALSFFMNPCRYVIIGNSANRNGLCRRYHYG
jgi:MFS family permease